LLETEHEDLEYEAFHSRAVSEVTRYFIREDYQKVLEDSYCNKCVFVVLNCVLGLVL